MDNRKYTFVGVQLSATGAVDLHLSKNRYWFDLQNKKGLGSYAVYSVEEAQSAVEILAGAVADEAIIAKGEAVVDFINKRIEKIMNEQLRLSMKGTTKRGRKPKAEKVETPKAEVADVSEADLQALVESLVPSNEEVVA